MKKQPTIKAQPPINRSPKVTSGKPTKIATLQTTKVIHKTTKVIPKTTDKLPRLHINFFRNSIALIII